MTKPDGPLGWLSALDRVLRGEATRPSRLGGGMADVPIGGLGAVSVALAMAYGACMGSYAIAHEGGSGPWQIAASAAKVPALFGLTLAITFPSLYVFNALVGSRLGAGAMAKLLVASMAVTLAVLASLGPIVGFFSVITDSYAFLKLLNVACFAASGFLGLGFLLQTLHRMTVADRPTPGRAPRAGPPAVAEAVTAPPEDPEAPPAAPSGRDVEAGPDEDLGALEPVGDGILPGRVRTVFRVWVVLFGLVGAQVAWVLRPFIGDPDLAFAWFRPRRSNFFEAVLRSIAELFNG